MTLRANFAAKVRKHCRVSKTKKNVHFRLKKTKPCSCSNCSKYYAVTWLCNLVPRAFPFKNGWGTPPIFEGKSPRDEVAGCAGIFLRYKDIKECFLWGIGSTGLLMNSELKWTQWFKGRLTLNPGLNLTRVSFPFVQKHILG